MKRIKHTFLSFALVAGLSLSYAWLLSRSQAPAPLTVFIWLLFTVLTAGFIFSLIGAFYVSHIPQQFSVPYEEFRANYHSDEVITEELEVPIWKRD